jgi:hypothetical protein
MWLQAIIDFFFILSLIACAVMIFGGLFSSNDDERDNTKIWILAIVIILLYLFYWQFDSAPY